MPLPNSAEFHRRSALHRQHRNHAGLVATGYAARRNAHAPGPITPKRNGSTILANGARPCSTISARRRDAPTGIGPWGFCRTLPEIFGGWAKRARRTMDTARCSKCSDAAAGSRAAIGHRPRHRLFCPDGFGRYCPKLPFSVLFRQMALSQSGAESAPWLLIGRLVLRHCHFMHRTLAQRVPCHGARGRGICSREGWPFGIRWLGRGPSGRG
jgi:hypothetical protein